MGSGRGRVCTGAAAAGVLAALLYGCGDETVLVRRPVEPGVTDTPAQLAPCEDLDGDGFGVGAGCLGPDCDDSDAALGGSGERLCYGGPAGTAGVGPCAVGVESCRDGVLLGCAGRVLPSAELCDGVDNDCDGEVDEALTRACYSGPAGTAGVSVCRAGEQACDAGAWSECLGEVLPVEESCDGDDTDCDGEIDEGLVRDCYSGPALTAGIGTCAAGLELCAAGAWSTCVGEAVPEPERCDGRDNDCDGGVDEGLTRACYGGAAGTEGVGACHGGSQLCAQGDWGECLGEILPAAEACDNADNDCDGEIDEALVRGCYGGPAGTEAIGACGAGAETCVQGAWDVCVGQTLPALEICDGRDNDCDGRVDEGLERACYTGAPGTEGLGACRGGTQSCQAGSYGSCVGEVKPRLESCDAVDNDCDGEIDEQITGACYAGPAGTEGVGSCRAGTRTCAPGGIEECVGQVLPGEESCDGLDEDCDGVVDDGLTRPCYGGPLGTEGVGVCSAGAQVCTAGAWGGCLDEVLPETERCDRRDNDCDGLVDEALSRACYTGAEGSEGVGVCHGGTQTCLAGRYGFCVGQTVPTAESCDGLDDDCDGEIDEGVVRACYTGPAGTEGVGACAAGSQGCEAGLWLACVGETLPSEERCDAVDDDCDGQVDESISRACYEGPAGTEGVGLCASGAQTCAFGGWGACVGQYVPVPESCDGFDNDCDGQVDEQVTSGCYSGPAGTEGLGICTGGVQHCSSGAWGECLGETTPGLVEVCDSGIDEDCDGLVDEEPCAGVGAHVCRSCPGASDANPGTQERPLLSIDRGIQNALRYGLDRVLVANESAGVASVYREAVTMVEGVSLEGRWVSGTPWTRTGQVRTVLEALDAAGLEFPAGITRATRLDGFEVRAAGGISGASETAAITIAGSSPLLRDVKAGGLAPGAPAAARSIGVKVTGSAATPASPRIEGLSGSALAVVDGGAGGLESFGILASGARLELQYVQISGGSATRTSQGVALVDSPASRILDSRLGGGNAESCAGLYATGRVAEILVERATVRGCEAGSTSPGLGAGAVFDGCLLAPKARAPLLRANHELTGGTVPGGRALGLAAMDGCRIEAVDNPNISGGSEAAVAIGALCSHRAWSGALGADSACSLRRNTVFGGLTMTVGEAVGIACEGSCLSQGAACAGSCRQLSENTVTAAAGLELTHVRITQSSPLIARNRIGVLAPACLKNTTIVGLELRGCGSRVESNFVVGGPCEKVWGLLQRNERRADLSWPAPDVHSNTLVGGGSTVNLTASESVGVGLSTLSAATAPALGLYRNNIVVGGQNLHRTAFAEYDEDADPEVLVANDFYNLPVAGGPNPELYVDEGSGALVSAAQINALGGTVSADNLSLDPVFVNTFFDFHLQVTTPLTGLGTTSGVPTVDIDGEPRPSPSGSRPDIGADEVF